MKRELDFKESNDGIFFMSIEDYKEEFGSTTICKIIDNYQY